MEHIPLRCYDLDYTGGLMEVPKINLKRLF